MIKTNLNRIMLLSAMVAGFSFFISCGGSNPGDAEHQPHVKGTISGGTIGSLEKNETGFTSATYSVANQATTIYGAGSAVNAESTFNTWALSFKGSGPGTYTGSTVFINYCIDKNETYTTTSSSATITVSSYEGPSGFVEGSFSASAVRHVGGGAGDTNTYQITNGAFRAYRLADMP
jgi:hypothetical protein